MKFLDQLTNGAELGAGAGSAVGELISPALQRSVAKENSKTRQAFAAVNARRVARDMRYRQGQAAAVNAAGGNSQTGSYLFAVAENARVAEENRQDALLGAKLRDIAEQKSIKSGAEAAIGFTSKLLGETASFQRKTFEGSN